MISSNSKPRISVIIPCYNCEKTINSTLKSLKNQTYKNFEVICINDGSKDSTESVIEDWVERNEINITLISQQNHGVSYTRNYGIRIAKGEFICFLDADDEYNSHFLEYHIEAITATNADVSYCRLSRNEEIVKECNEKIVYAPQNSNVALSKLLYEMWNFGFYCYFYKKEFVLGNNIWFDEKTKFGEDREFIWKYTCRLEKFVYINLPLYWYRENADSATYGKTSWRNVDAIYAIQRADEVVKTYKPEFYQQYHSYMNARVTWAVAKAFAIDGNKTLFKRLTETFDIRRQMKVTKKDSVRFVRIASNLYLLSPSLFYYAIYVYGFIGVFAQKLIKGKSK